MSKQRFYLLAGIMTVIVIILIAVNAIRNIKKRDAAIAANSTNSATPTQTVNVEDVPTPEQSTPTEIPIPSPTATGPLPDRAAQEFYTWYVSHHDPLKSGEYATSGHIAEDYVKKIKGFVARGYTHDPVFTCIGVTPPKHVSYTEPTYDKTKNSAIVGVKMNPEDQSLLYKIILAHNGQKWLVTDVRCAK